MANRSAIVIVFRTLGSCPTPLRRGVLLCLVWTLALAAYSGASRAAERTWKAGIAKAVITPEKPVWLAGYGTKRPPDGKLHDLWMKALALEDDAGRRRCS